MQDLPRRSHVYVLDRVNSEAFGCRENWRGNGITADKTTVNINADAVLIYVVVYPILFDPACV
jgi:hypothetical protein